MAAYTEASLQAAVEVLASKPERSSAALELLAEVRCGLGTGKLRVASPSLADTQGSEPARWQVHTWVKVAILLMSRLGVLTGMPAVANGMSGTEADTTPWRKTPPPGCRVPVGSLVREGAYLAEGVTCLPPSVLQLGCHVGPGTVIDSMVSVGLGAQVGAGVQLSCGAIVGGAIVPLQKLPTIIEDGVLMGSASGVFDGAQLGRNSILLAGTQIIPALGIYDPQQERTPSTSVGGWGAGGSGRCDRRNGTTAGRPGWTPTPDCCHCWPPPRSNHS